jgi:hypothetical protein
MVLLIRTLYILSLFIFFSMPLAQASTERDLLIQNELNCIDNHSRQDGSIGWNDVCDIPESSSQQHLDIVNQQMDQMQEPPSQRKSPPQISPQVKSRTSNKVSFDLAFQTETFDYKTGNQWPYYYSLDYSESNKVQMNGPLYGLYVSSTWRGPLHTWGDFWGKEEIPNYAKIEYDALDGSSNYKSFITGKLNGINAWKMDGRVLLGFDHVWNDTTDFTPYFGIGFRRFSNKAGGWEDFVEKNFARFTTINTLYYLPVGIETHTNLNERWDMNFKLENDFVLFGKASFSLNDIPGPFSGTDLTTGQPVSVFLKETDSNLKGGFGVRTSFKLIRKYKLCAFYIEPYFDYLYLNESQKVQEKAIGTNGTNYVSAYPDGSPYTPIYEPKNYTLEVGTRWGVQF